MTINAEKTSSSHKTHPTSVHYHTNQPVVYPYKPPEKSDPPGAHLYKDVWFIFKVATHAYLALCDEVSYIPYSAGFSLGAIKAGFQWCEYGPPKKISSDSEMVDFGATAHSSSIVSQICILAESFLAVAVPTVIDNPRFSFIFGSPSPSKRPRYNPALADTREKEEYLSGSSYWPTTNAQLFKWAFIFLHGIYAGEEVINRFAKWIDKPQEKKKR